MTLWHGVSLQASTPSTAPRPQRPQQHDNSRRQQRSFQPRQQRSYQQQQPQQRPEGGSSTDEDGDDAVPLESHSLKVRPGEVELGRVVNATPRGAKVLLLDGSDVKA